MAKGKELVAIFAVNDDSSDAPIMYHFDSAETRAEFLKLVDPRHCNDAFKVINKMSARDAKVLRNAVEVVEMDDIEQAKASGDPQEFFDEDDVFKFYDCGDELRDLYDAQIESGERVRGTGRTC